MTAFDKISDRVKAAMPRNEVTTGNLLSIASTAILIGGLVWQQSGAMSELRGVDMLLASRVERLEQRQKQTDSDHDLLIEIRTELRQLRQRIDSLAPVRGLSIP